jgi:hypothetical protein
LVKPVKLCAMNRRVPARRAASRSSPSITTGTAPAAVRSADLSAARVLAVTW